MTADLAWASGLFEGEGCFHFSNARQTRSIVARLESTDEDVVKRFGKIVGLGLVSGPYNKGKNKPTWVWRISSFEGVQQVICRLWDNLGIRRKAKAKEVLLNYLSAPMKQVHKRKTNRKLTQEQVVEIKRKLDSGSCQADIAYEVGCSPSLVSRINSGARH